MDLFTPSFFLSIGIVVLLVSLLAIFLLRRIQAIHDETVMAFDLVSITARKVSDINQFLVSQQQQKQPQQQPSYPIKVDDEEVIEDEDESDNNIKIIILADHMNSKINEIDEDCPTVSDEHDIEELDDMEMDLKQSVVEEDAAILDIDETVRPVHVEVDYKALKLPELRKYASEHGVTHVHNMKKNELLTAIELLL